MTRTLPGPERHGGRNAGGEIKDEDFRTASDRAPGGHGGAYDFIVGMRCEHQNALRHHGPCNMSPGNMTKSPYRRSRANLAEVGQALGRREPRTIALRLRSAALNAAAARQAGSRSWTRTS